MADNATMLTLKGVTILYPRLHTPSKPHGADEDAPETYSGLFLVDPAEKAKIDAAIDAAIADRWGNKPPANLKMPYRDGDEKDLRTGDFVKKPDFYRGKLVVSANSYKQPTLWWGPQKVMPSEDEMYSGLVCAVSLNASAYDATVSKGVKFYLNGVWVTGKGKKIETGVDGAQELGKLADDLQFDGDMADDVDMALAS